MHRLSATQQDRTDRHTVAGRCLQQVVGDVGGVDVRHHQQVGIALQWRVRHDLRQQFWIERSVAVHFAVDFELRRLLLNQLQRGAHLDRRFAVAGTEVGMRQQRCAWMQAETTHFFSGHDGDFRQFFRCRVFVDVGVYQHQLAALQDHAVHGGVDIDAFALAQHLVDVMQMQLRGAVGAADHAVGVALVDRHGTDQGVATTHFQLGVLLGNATTLGHFQESLPVVAIAAVKVRVDDFEVDVRTQAQAEFLDALFQHFWTADQDRLGQAFVDDDLHRAQDALFFAFGKDDALLGFRRLLGGLEDRAHEGAAVIDELFQLFRVSIHVRDRTCRHAGSLGRACNCSRDLDHQARIEGLRNDVLGTERQVGHAVSGGDDVGLLGLRQLGNRVHRSDFHFARDRGGAGIQRAAEDVRKAQDVVDLVRIVGTAGGDDGVIAYGHDIFRQDFRRRVGQRQHQWTRRHLLDHVLFQHAAGGHAEENVGVRDHVGQGTRIGFAREAFLVRIHQFGAALVDYAGQVGDVNVFDRKAEIDDQVQASQRCSARAGDDQFDFLDALADHLEAVQDRRTDDDRSAVLIVMEDRDLHAVAQLALDIEAFGRLDVFQVDTAESRFQRGDDVAQLVRIGFVDFDVEDVDAGEFLEQHGLAFHHRLGSQRADVAQPEDRRTITDDRNQIAARSVFESVGRIGDDFFTGRSDARRVRQRQVSLIG